MISDLPDYVKSRQKMVDTQLVSRGIRDTRVLECMAKVPRHLFVEEALYSQAYNDYPLPIGEKQTISQPYIVALMTEALQLKGTERVLEIGTGSGYQTAILADLAYKVYSIERLNTLVKRARRILDMSGCINVVVKLGDGTIGWKEESPFDAIIVTAASPGIPAPLVDQLASPGRLIIPVGDRFSQSLIRVLKEGSGVREENLGGVRFVSLVGQYGWEEERNNDRHSN
ncbi:MAG: protein-L-isoaspartate(D-aspartate) O-methyltransferase [Pseudomonadota bacterium]